MLPATPAKPGKPGIPAKPARDGKATDGKRPQGGRRFQDKSEKVGKERQLKPGTKALHKRSNQGLVQINCLKNVHDF